MKNRRATEHGKRALPAFVGYDPWRKALSRRAHLPEKAPVRTNQVAVKQSVTLTG